MATPTMTKRMTRAVVLMLLCVAAVPAVRAADAENPPPSARIVPTDGPVTSTTGIYVYDPSGNVAAIGASSYVYDPMGRVTTASVDRFGNAQSQTYTYDVYGNRLTDGTLTYAADPSTNRLTSLGAQYDAAGNLTQWQPPYSATVRTYSHDALNTVMREKVTTGAGDEYVVHIYTADDERYWNYAVDSAGEVQSRYTLRDLGGQVLREFVETTVEATQTWTARDTVYRDGLLLASHDTATGATHHYSLDHLGTPRVVTDQDHVKVAEHTYFPFGAEYTDGSVMDGRLRFTGHEERDSDLLGENRGELDYMHARFYSSNLGRFLSTDPVFGAGGPQAWNRYAYVLNKPMILIDPLGLCGESNAFIGPTQPCDFGFAMEIDVQGSRFYWTGIWGSMGDGRPHATRDEAALKAIQVICAKSVRIDREFGGALYEADEAFTFSAPRQGGKHSMTGILGTNSVWGADAYMSMLPPPGVRMVGTYHTHGAYSDGYLDEAISPNDRIAAFKEGLATYVGTPSGRVLKYDPRTPTMRAPNSFDFQIGTVPCK